MVLNDEECTRQQLRLAPISAPTSRQKLPFGSMRPDAGCHPLLRAFPEQHHPHRLDQDKQIQKKRMVLHVVEVELQFLARILD